MRKIRHDLKNKLIGIYGIEDDNELIRTKIKEIIGELEDSKKNLYTDNCILNSVLNIKYSAAQVADIKIESNIFVPKYMNIDYGDMGVLFGNLLDNAIEANQGVDRKKRWINVSVKYEEHILIINIKNSKIRGSRRKKKGYLNHGIGLNSVKQIVEKFNGIVEVQDFGEMYEVIIREDMKLHARENGYRLEWDAEARDYIGMTRRFCDIEEIYAHTKVDFCEPGEDIEPYERSQQRNIVLKLPEDDIKDLCAKAGRNGMTVSQLLENFVSDLVGGSRTNGSDERMYANQWFERCWFSFEPEQTFLSYLLDWGQIEYAIEDWTELEDYKGQDTLDEYDKEEMESLKESLDELFEEYQSANKNPADSTLEEGMQKVIKWDKERQMLLAGNPVERRKER